MLNIFYHLTNDQKLWSMKILTILCFIFAMIGMLINPVKIKSQEIEGTIYIDTNGKIWEFASWEEFVVHVIAHKDDKIEIDYGDH